VAAPAIGLLVGLQAMPSARGERIDDIVAAIDKHRGWLVEHGELRRRREARASAEVEAIALGVLRERLGSVRSGAALPALAAQVAAGRLDPYAAADQLLATLDTESSAPLGSPIGNGCRCTG
jgi:LAO/AO transport system kinase